MFSVISIPKHFEQITIYYCLREKWCDVRAHKKVLIIFIIQNVYKNK